MKTALIFDFSGCMCRECGAECHPMAWEDRGGLCPSCAYKPCNPRDSQARSVDLIDFVPVAYVNGREIYGEDPIRRAIERASHNLLNDLSNGSKA